MSEDGWRKVPVGEVSDDEWRKAPAGEVIDDGCRKAPAGEVRRTGGGGVGGEYQDEPPPGNERCQLGGGGIGKGQVAREEVSMWPAGGGEYLMDNRR